MQADWTRNEKENLVRGNNIRKFIGIKENDPLGMARAQYTGRKNKMWNSWQNQDQEEGFVP